MGELDCEGMKGGGWIDVGDLWWFLDQRRRSRVWDMGYVMMVRLDKWHGCNSLGYIHRYGRDVRRRDGQVFVYRKGQERGVLLALGRADKDLHSYSSL